MHAQAKYFHAFNSFNEQIGPARFKKILAYFESAQNAWESGGAQDFIRAGLEETLAYEIVLKRPQMDLKKELAKLAKENITILTTLDEDYPKLLKEIYDPPYIMYMRGQLSSDDDFSIGVVGTRKISTYGQQVTSQISRDLAQAGLTIISGLAHGVDTLAHREAIAQKKRTIAVIGSSLDWQSLFPPENRKLAEEIIQNGAILSEYPLGSFALKHHFPARNRIISGLSLGTLVVEAPEKSGALITAKHALEQNREVFAIPGPIYSPSSLGPNNLIKIGAKLVCSVQDILDELNLKNLALNIETRRIIAETPEERIILELLSGEPVVVDKIVEMTKLETATVNATLALMEMKGMVRNLGGMQYVLAR